MTVLRREVTLSRSASLYGKWLPVDNPDAIDSFDRPTLGRSGRSKAVANGTGSRSGSPHVTDEVGRGERIRASDLLVPNEVAAVLHGLSLPVIATR